MEIHEIKWMKLFLLTENQMGTSQIQVLQLPFPQENLIPQIVITHWTVKDV